MNKLDAVKRSVAATAGPRPHFLDNPDCDRLLAMVLALAGELGTVYERLDSVERLLEAQHGFDRTALASYEPAPEASAERLEWHEALVRRVLRVLSAELAELDDGQKPPSSLGD